ncbi:MAG: response regulator transcription factor [Actinomycetota bacterium]
MRLLLVDDHALVRNGIASLLETREGYEVAGECSGGVEALEALGRLDPDVILMDVHMPGMDGIEATRKILAEHPESKVVMLTVAEDEEHLLEALKAGARGYVAKSAKAGEFFEVLEAVSGGEVAVSRLLASRLLEEFAREEPGARTSRVLTKSEARVLELVGQGKTNSETAATLFISENTVKFHLRNILSKLQAHTRAQAVAKAMQEGLIEGPPPA